MRHRRRYTTQTLQKKKRPTVTLPAYQPQRRTSSRFLKILFYLLLIALIVYAGIEYLYPPMAELWSELMATEVVQEEVQQKPEFPVQNDPAPSTDYLTPIPELIQVEVLNGCGGQGIAKFLSDQLRKYNYDVINSGNYLEGGKLKWDVEKTRLIDQIGNIEQARKLGELMGIDYAQVESFENPSPIADITIVIGKDYSSLTIFKENQ